MDRNREKRFVTALLLAFFAAWTTFWYLPTTTIFQLGIEDGPVEYLSALDWLLGCTMMAALFVRRRNPWHLLLAGFFFLCLGEEISWGQRLIGFATPEFIADRNFQGEFNLHNLHVFDRQTGDKNSWQMMFTLGRMFSLFWLTYCCLLPVAVRYSSVVEDRVRRIRLPIVPLFFGPFFLANYFAFKYYEVLHPTVSAALEIDDRASLSSLLGETREWYASFAFLLIALWEYRDERSKTE